MERLFRMPLDMLIASEVTLANAPNARGETPLRTATRHTFTSAIGEAPSHAQLTLTEFPSAYRLLLIMTPACPPDDFDPREAARFASRCAETRYMEAPPVMRLLNRNYATLTGTPYKDTESPYGKRNWHYVPCTHRQDYRFIAKRDITKQHPDALQQYISLQEVVKALLNGVGAANSNQALDLAGRCRLYRK